MQNVKSEKMQELKLELLLLGVETSPELITEIQSEFAKEGKAFTSMDMLTKEQRQRISDDQFKNKMQRVESEILKDKIKSRKAAVRELMKQEKDK